MVNLFFKLKNWSFSGWLFVIAAAILLLGGGISVLPPKFMMILLCGVGLVIAGFAWRLHWQEQEINRLKMANAFLKMSKRKITIDNIRKTSENGKNLLHFSMSIFDAMENLAEKFDDLTIDGRELYVDTMVIKFEDKYVEVGDEMKGKALCLIRRLYSETQRPVDGIPIDEEGKVPKACSSDNESFQKFQEKLWGNFWNLAQEPEVAKKQGIRAAHGSGVSMQLQENGTYKIEMRSTGELTFVRENVK